MKRTPKAPSLTVRFDTKGEFLRMRRAATIAKQSLNSFALTAIERRADAIISEYDTAQAAIREAQAVQP